MTDNESVETDGGRKAEGSEFAGGVGGCWRTVGGASSAGTGR